MWERVSSLMNIIFDSEPVYGDNDKYIKTKIKSSEDRVNINFQGKILKYLKYLDSVIKSNKKYYHQTLLEECKYEIKRDKIENLINDDLEQSSSDESDSESDSESDNGYDNDESSD